MGMLDSVRNTLGVGSSKRSEGPKPPTAQTIGEIRSVLTGKTNIPKEVQELFLPHEKLADVRAIAQEIKTVGPETFGVNRTTYTMAVMPSIYDNPLLHTPEFGRDPDVFFDGEKFHSKRKEEILACSVDIKEGELDAVKYVPYYSRQRYFVEVNGRALPKASVYHFANGQMQIHSCDYDSKGRSTHFKNVIDGKLKGEVVKEYGELGNVSRYVENEFSDSGELVRSTTFTARFTKDGSGPGKDVWVESRVVAHRDQGGKWIEKPAEEFSRKENPQELYMNGWDLRLRRLAMPHLEDTAKEPYIGKPGYSV